MIFWDVFWIINIVILYNNRFYRYYRCSCYALYRILSTPTPLTTLSKSVNWNCVFSNNPTERIASYLYGQGSKGVMLMTNTIYCWLLGSMPACLKRHSFQLSHLTVLSAIVLYDTRRRRGWWQADDNAPRTALDMFVAVHCISALASTTSSLQFLFFGSVACTYFATPYQSSNSLITSVSREISFLSGRPFQ